jgi:long-subunit acyl-CoA synthetase (AMP-forming)
MLTHRTVASEVAANRQFFLRTAGEPRTSSAMRRYFSFLTLAHIFDRCGVAAGVKGGGQRGRWCCRVVHR